MIDSNRPCIWITFYAFISVVLYIQILRDESVRLPSFNQADLANCFLSVDLTFAQNKVGTEASKFRELLQYLEQLRYIK